MDQPQAGHPASPASRPIGITILAVLAAIGGLLSLVGSIGLLAAGFMSGIALILVLLTLAFGVLYLALAYGLWTLQPWAWTLGVGLMVASIALTVLNLTQGLQYPIGAVISAAISAAVLFYLTRLTSRRLSARRGALRSRPANRHRIRAHGARPPDIRPPRALASFRLSRRPGTPPVHVASLTSRRGTAHALTGMCSSRR